MQPTTSSKKMKKDIPEIWYTVMVKHGGVIVPVEIYRELSIIHPELKTKREILTFKKIHTNNRRLSNSVFPQSIQMYNALIVIANQRTFVFVKLVTAPPPKLSFGNKLSIVLYTCVYRKHLATMFICLNKCFPFFSNGITVAHTIVESAGHLKLNRKRTTAVYDLFEREKCKPPFFTKYIIPCHI